MNKNTRLDLDILRSGGKQALSRALSLLESAPNSPETLALLDEAYNAGKAQVIGLTGPPGVGKSTLTGALIAKYRARGERVGVIAVDPTSKRSGGALLGDRIRLAGNPSDQDLFVRSMAARDRLGGLAPMTHAAMIIMRALYDRVLIETVGVGQSETDVEAVADSIIFCVQPASGDSLQFMKAGIVEVPDIAVVTKADLGPAARRAKADLSGALGLALDHEGGRGWNIPVLLVSANKGTGLEDMIGELDGHFSWLNESELLVKRRERQAEGWFRDAVKECFGREGLALLPSFERRDGESPFAAATRFCSALELRFKT